MILFNVGEVLIILFSGFFIWYSNSFFIKSRKKEFATYMLLGMSKRQTARLNFIENTIIIFLAFFTGTILGLVFNKFFIMLLFALMRTGGNAKFELSFQALRFSIIVFSIIFIIISIHGNSVIYRNKLIDMFNAAKKVESGLKVSFITFIVSTASIVFIGYGYYLAIAKLGDNIEFTPKIVLFVVLGTILFFTATVSLIIHINKKNEKSLFRGTKLISTAQLYYRYRGNVGTLSVIAITTSIAICALTMCFCAFGKAEANSRNMRPFSVEYINGNKQVDSVFEDIVKKHKEISVKYRDDIEFLQVKGDNPDWRTDNNISIINESQFDKINEHQNVDRKANLKNKNECYYITYNTFNGSPKYLIGKNIDLKVKDKCYILKIINVDTKLFTALDHFRGAVVVNDKVYNEIKSLNKENAVIKVTGYMLKNDFSAKAFSNDLLKNMPKDNSVLTFYAHYEDGLKVFGILAFIGIFIGILFITATGSIIYFKMSMEAKEDKTKFITLRKIGVSKREITGSVAKELMILFGAPFIIAVGNSYAASIPIGKAMDFKITREYLIIVLIYAIFYGIYYLVTLKSYVKTVSE
ncbi:ABC transporter permease [Clostridium hydrogenum]|uniref:ABC transporter permease n=1 Tax=Clostridium hydrogenum TaxID=2855764 RepID=UPI0038B39329